VHNADKLQNTKIQNDLQLENKSPKRNFVEMFLLRSNWRYDSRSEGQRSKSRGSTKFKHKTACNSRKKSRKKFKFGKHVLLGAHV